MLTCLGWSRYQLEILVVVRSYLGSLNKSLTLVVFLLSFFLVGCGGGGSSQSSNAESGPSYSINGRVYPASNTSVDRDTESDTSFWSTSNNSVSDAQVISNPVVLGGYISGLSGNYDETSSYSKDTSDFFRVYLSAGQKVSLAVFHAASFSSNAVDMEFILRPYSDVGTITDSISISDEGLYSRTVQNSGDYIIELKVRDEVCAPVLYTLSLSDYIVSNAYESVSPVSEFIPGEVLIRFKEKDQSASSGDVKRNRTSSAKIAQMTGLSLKGATPGLGQLYSISNQQLDSVLAFDSDMSATANHAMQKKWQTLEYIKQLRDRDDIELASPNFIYRTSFVPNDPLFGRQWSLPLINAPAAWELATGAGVTVAVIDSGVDQDHIDLSNNLLLSPSSIQSDGYDFISNVDWAGDGDGMDDNPRDLSVNLHGQHVAGIIAAEGDNNTGVIGVAYGAKIMPLRALGVDDIGSTVDIANAVLYAAGLANSSGQLPNAAADIINLSLGSSDFDVFLRDAINAAVNQNIFVVAAAGNENTSAPFYPAAYDNVIGVSSVDSDKSKSYFSNYGSYVDVAAPGGKGLGSSQGNGYQERILSTVYANAYLDYQGTSMAAPHVAGVLALMKERKPDLTLAEVNYALEQGFITDDIGDSNYFGSGLINAAKAVELASGLEIPPVLSVVPNSLSFLAGNSHAVLTLSNPGSGIISASLSTTDDWLSIVPQSVDAEGLGEYQIIADHSAIPLNETLSGALSIAYQINGGSLQTKSVAVFASNSASEEDSVGELFVYLLSLQDINDAEQNNDAFISIFKSTPATRMPGQDYYEFNFTGIPEGDYYLEASTDHDSDNIYFDPGEGVGAYPLLTDPAIIRLGSSLSDMHFDVSFPYQILEGNSNGMAALATSNLTRKPRVLNKSH